MGQIRVYDLSLFSMIFLVLCSISLADLKVGFYHHTCPSAESIVRQKVSDAVARDPGLAAGLLRMHFHDCFVRGCDASILLDSTPSAEAEKDSPVNNPSLRGYEVIDAAKATIEAACPHTVSCSDIIAFAARDSAYFFGNILYSVPSGRRDGRTSIKEETRTLPSPFLNAEQLQSNFNKKGLSLDEMVTLSGGHSIGRTHCSSFASNRLYNFTVQQKTDPSIAESFVNHLKSQCPPHTVSLSDTTTTDLDVATPLKLDNKYYKNLAKGRGVLASDQTLWTSPLTKGLVLADIKDKKAWADKFAAAMVKMGYIEVLTGNQGEIRKSCRVVNSSK